jgi:serine phosphatase RsbU (regulator of sigma subunit)/anti-sigma regulatory factor (Ser/Thr protein kinase)
MRPVADAPPDDRELDLARLMSDAAWGVHSARSADEKLGWAIAATRQATRADFCAFVAVRDGRAIVVSSDGAPEGEVTPIARAQLAQVVHRSMPDNAGNGPNDEVPDLGVAVVPTGVAATAANSKAGTRWRDQIAAPVLGVAGELHGLLLVGHEEAGHFTQTEAAVAEAIASHLGVALDNAATLGRLAEVAASQREAVHQLQFAVLPPVPEVDGAELGRHYVAAGANSPTGGDLYDWVVLADGTLHVSVVDVLGKGVAATKDALAITQALRWLVLDGYPLADVLARVDSLVTAHNPDLAATAIVAHYSPSDGQLQIAGAGHPPVLLVRATGEVERLEAPGIALGWPGAGSRGVVTAQLGRSETAVFYTDGLVEATKDILDGLDALSRAAAETSAYPATEMARALVERALADAERRDDVVALVLRRRVPPPPASEHRLGPFQHRFTPRPAAVTLARHLLSDWLAHQPIDPVEVDDLLLVASELCTNAMRASSGQPGAVVLRALIEGDTVVVETEDDGPGFEWPHPEPGLTPLAELEQGRGLYLVSALVDEATIERTEDGHTIVRSRKRAVVGAQSAGDRSA